MKTIKLVLTNNNQYKSEAKILEGLAYLAEFLSQDIGTHDIFYKEFLKNDNIDWAGGYTVDLVKQHNKLFICSNMGNSFERHHSDFVTTTKQLLDIIKQWELIISQHPNEIFIIQEDNIIKIIGSSDQTHDS